MTGKMKATSRRRFKHEKRGATPPSHRGLGVGERKEEGYCRLHGVRTREKTVFHIYLTFASSGIVPRLTCSWSGPKPGVAAAAAAMVVGIS